MATDSGYSNQKKKGLAQFETVHNLGSAAYGKSVAPKSLFQISLVSETVVSVSDIIGPDGQVQYWNIEITAHGASVGNVFRIDDGALLNAEYEIIKVIDVDNFYILPITDIKPVASDTGVIMGWVTTRVGKDGSSAISILSAPTSYNLNGIPQTVEQDTVVPANNRALPNLNFIYKDGVQVPITKDTGTPSNTVGLPVEIVSGSGTEINITAGDINIQTTDMGLNFDSLRIGDGSGNYIKANANGSIDANILGTVSVSGPLTDVQLRATPVPVSGTVSVGNFPVTQPISAASLPLPTGAASEITLASINSKLNADFGVSSGAVRTSAQIGNATGTADFGSGASGAQTLRTVLATRHEAVTTPLASRISDGTDFISAIALAAAQLDIASATKLLQTSAVILGWDGSSHKEIALTSTGHVQVEQTSKDGAVTNAQITVGLTAVRATVSGSAPSANRRLLLIKPSKTNTGAIYFGSSSVSTLNGMEIIGPDRVEFKNDHSDYYLISDTAGQTVEILEV